LLKITCSLDLNITTAINKVEKLRGDRMDILIAPRKRIFDTAFNVWNFPAN
jgi:hypothetical protein